MKRFFLITLSIVIAFLLTEVLVGVVIGFPKYGVEYKVRYRNGGAVWSNVKSPHSAIYNVEGWKSVNYNNYGLPGSDIKSLDSLIVVLGSSFVEALQHDPEQIATSVFQRDLDKSGSSRQVMNLGCSGHDPYDSWFRLQYFEKKLGFHTHDVILVINSDNQAWFSRHPKPFQFEKYPWFGTVNTRLTNIVQTKLRNTLSTAELTARALKSDTDADVGDETNKTGSLYASHISEELKSCLSAYSQKYDRFKVLSIMSETDFNSDLASYCETQGIDCLIRPITFPKYMINGAGHLNLQGNFLLGKTLYSSYRS